MKHTVYGISLTALAVLIIAIVLGVSGKNVRKNEMETALEAGDKAWQEAADEGAAWNIYLDAVTGIMIKAE